METVFGILSASYEVLLAASFYILIGLLAASLIHTFFSPDIIARYLGGDRLSSVFFAALFGVPLPLCSCAVVPTALSLHDKGASPGAVAAFLISTPESGVDSIAVTYALMNPIMAIARPVVAFFSAFLAGALIHFGGVVPPKLPHLPTLEKKESCCHDSGEGEQRFDVGGLWKKLKSGFHYGFVELLGIFGKWFLIGILIAGLIDTLIPSDWIQAYLGAGWLSCFIALIFSIPLYICATSATPVAAALILKGMSPGVALVFLIAGPATNAASLVVLLKTFGKRFVAIYLGSVMVMALLAGYTLDLLLHHFQWDFPVLSGEAMEMLPMEVQMGAATLFLGFCLWTLFTWPPMKKRGH